jgi:hypothetical protein
MKPQFMPVDLIPVIQVETYRAYLLVGGKSHELRKQQVLKLRDSLDEAYKKLEEYEQRHDIDLSKETFTGNI